VQLLKQTEEAKGRLETLQEAEDSSPTNEMTLKIGSTLRMEA
jgi:hypothetical protein